MKKVVFFTDIKNLHDAVDNFNIESFANQEVPVKLHMGEEKNKTFSKPSFVKYTIDELKKVNAKPYLLDTTVAYPGLRSAVSSYKKLANMHGFTTEKIGCKVVIDNRGIPVKIENRNYKVANHIFNSTHIFTVTHIKGHIATGMGGAIKNLGMGGVTKETKIKMHWGSKPVHSKDACTYCGDCAEVCPFVSIKVEKNAWIRDPESCFGCGVCIDACKDKALVHRDADIQYFIACAALACVKNKNVIYLNELKRITKKCDCVSFTGPIICPDIGYLVSDDPVAIDKASLDLINDVKGDIFEKENKISPMKQIKFGEEIGLGSSSYQLIEL